MSSWGQFNTVPHMGPNHIATLACVAQRAKVIVEYGSGSSTLFLAMVAPFARILSIEHDKFWHDRVHGAIQVCRGLGMQMAPVLMCLVADDPIAYAGATTPEFLHPDMIFIDGKHRPACLREAWERMPSGGIVLLHDAQREQPRIFEGWTSVMHADTDWLENPEATLFAGRKP